MCGCRAAIGKTRSIFYVNFDCFNIQVQTKQCFSYQLVDGKYSKNKLIQNMVRNWNFLYIEGNTLVSKSIRKKQVSTVIFCCIKDFSKIYLKFAVHRKKI